MRLAGENTGRAAATNAARLTRSVGSRRMKLPRAHSLRFDLHISHKDLLIRLGFTKNVSRHAIDLDERVERNKGNILHKNPSCLLEQGDPFFVIAGFLLLVNVTLLLLHTRGNSVRGGFPMVFDYCSNVIHGNNFRQS